MRAQFMRLGRSYDQRLPRRVIRLARIVVLAVIIGIGINHIYWSVIDWHLKDMNAYWDAALRLRHGQALFPAAIDIEASEVFRYSPWFAWLWVPLTYAPRLAVNIGWSAVLLGASAAAVTPLVQRRAWVAVAFFLPVLIAISAGGNAHALVIAALVLGVERRSGPLWIAVGASLKFFPFLFVLTYIGRREWWRAVASAILTAVLLVPFLLYDLSAYVTDAGGAALLWAWPIVYVVAMVGLVAASLWLARSRFGWLASATAVAISLPRFFLYDVTYFMAAVPAPGDRGIQPENIDNAARWHRAAYRDPGSLQARALHRRARNAE